MIQRRQLLGLASLMATPLGAHANDYPSQPISLVTPLAAGDAADRAARLMSQELSRLLNATITVVNRPGAGGSLGTQSVIRAPKDGYTLLYAQNSPMTIRRVIEPEAANYDPLKDLVPLALTTRSPSVLVVHRDAPFKTLKDMVEQSTKAPNSVRVGNAGPGSVGDVSVQLVNSATGASLTSVNYRGAAPAVTDLLGGHIEGVILALGALGTQIRSGNLRALAISSPFPEFPNIPTLRQLGYKADILGVWFGFFMPAGVPRNVVDTIVPALEEVTRNAGISAQLLPAGIVQEWGSGRALSDEIANEFQAVSALLRPAAKTSN
ncbi:tripartite tricarboxylate transporter substrate binding protein [Hydrogenophaga sp. SNF1]|uniref:Bug family tripartite tricarboxylate transporter substrate binding protein n=1 Tax=Hydrogenophaga sp. SNF1 TaxID=3098762 RepID=UPI002ACC2F5A|nr:tripartite tricarboxylate transporter substrate binding protein [Hydrogenophaga sp. SNF1]WQB84715.1 tripartite tricarboxylate transporter substrate binding protein [Hydrogenophaga sp. SNF1]